MFQTNDIAELINARKGLYASQPGARARVLDVTTGRVTGKQLVRLTWLWATKGEAAGWYEAADFQKIEVQA